MSRTRKFKKYWGDEIDFEEIERRKRDRNRRFNKKIKKKFQEQNLEYRDSDSEDADIQIL